MVQRDLEMGRPLADVAGQDQPVIRMVPEPFERLAVRGVAQVEVADGEKLQA